MGDSPRSFQTAPAAFSEQDDGEVESQVRPSRPRAAVSTPPRPPRRTAVSTPTRPPPRTPISVAARPTPDTLSVRLHNWLGLRLDAIKFFAKFISEHINEKYIECLGDLLWAVLIVLGLGYSVFSFDNIPDVRNHVNPTILKFLRADPHDEYPNEFKPFQWYLIYFIVCLLVSPCVYLVRKYRDKIEKFRNLPATWLWRLIKSLVQILVIVICNSVSSLMDPRRLQGIKWLNSLCAMVLLISKYCGFKIDFGVFDSVISIALSSILNSHLPKSRLIFVGLITFALIFIKNFIS